MVTRRVVTEEVGGRSRIMSDGPAPHRPYWDELWVTEPGDPLGHEPMDASLEPPSGGAGWRIHLVPPDAVMRQVLAERQKENDVTDSEGFHKTNTVDYVYVLDGDVTLQLDEGAVLLHPGDCVVQRNTNHAWRNDNDTPVRLLAVMLTLP